MKKTFKNILAIVFCIVALSSTMIMASAVGKPTAKVKSVTYNSVTLYWTKVSGAEYYQIQRSTDGKKWSTIAEKVTATSYTDSKKLTAGVTYCYRLRSVDKGLLKTTYSSWTSTIKAKPVPAAVKNFKVKSVGYNSITLSWSKVSGASGYEIQYLSGKTWKKYKTTTSTSLKASSLTLGKSYSFRIRAYRTVSKKAVYGSVSSAVKATTVLAAPSSVVLKGISTSALKLAWSEVSGAKGYEVYNPATKKWVSAGTSRSLTIKSLKAGTKYAFKVRAYSGKVKGTSSKSYSFITTPAAPKTVTVTAATDSTISFKWSSVTGAAGYKPEIYNATTKKWTALSTTTGTSAKATGLDGYTKYSIRVRAYIKNSNVKDISATSYGAYSSTVSTQTVMGATTASASAKSSTEITVKWSKLNGASKYRVEKFDATENAWLIYDFGNKTWIAEDEISGKTVTTTSTSMTDKGEASRSDIYRVRGIDSKGIIGTPSSPATGYTKDVYVSSSTYQTTIRWTAAEGAKKFQIYSRYPSTEVIYEATDKDVTYNSETGLYELKLNLAPQSIHSLLIISDSETTNWLTLYTKALSIVTSTSSSSYKPSVNSQLLYLARAINNTKGYKDTITVKNNSEVSYSINSLKLTVAGIAIINKKTPEDVAKFFASFDDGSESISTQSTEKYNKTLKFEGGKATDDGKTIALRQYVEPSSNKTSTAYLYKGLTSQTAWTNGFSSVKTTKASNGDYTINVTFKQESGDANYHNGFMSSFSAADFGAADGFEMNNFKVGSSTLKAVIDSDGILKSYVVNSPYEAAFKASFTAEEDSEDVKKGQEVAMTMSMSGGTVFNYTFTR